MGDLNAKIGADNTGYEQVMGKHELGRMNENGEQFAEFCSQNNLVIGASVFEHRRTHKVTWRSQEIGSTMCVYVGGSGVLYRM